MTKPKPEILIPAKDVIWYCVPVFLLGLNFGLMLLRLMELVTK